MIPSWGEIKLEILDRLGLRSEAAISWGTAILDAAALLALAIVASYVLGFVLRRGIRRLAARTETDLDDRIIALLDRPVRRLIVVAGVYGAIRVIPLPRTIHNIATGIVFVVAVWITVRVLTRVVLVLLSAYGRKVKDPDGQFHFEKDYVPLISKIVGVVFAVMGLIAVLKHFGQDVNSLVAALGVGGIALSFASKETLGNMLAGFTILIDRPFRLGDRIRLASGEIGDVIDVGTRSTRVKLLDHNMLIVPNSELVNTRVVNFNYPSHATQARLDVGIAAGSDVARVKQVIREVILGEEGVEKEPAPSVQMGAFNEVTVALSAFYVISEVADAAVVQDRVRTSLYARFQAEGIRAK